MAKKERLEIPEDTAALVLYRSDRCCCVCRTPRKAIQIHHIDENPANNEEQNLAVLCLECHNDTQIEGGFGRKLDAAQVRRYRDDWVRDVESRRALLVPAEKAQGQDDERRREHDRAIFGKSQEVMSEGNLNALVDVLWNEDAYHQKQFHAAVGYVEFWGAANHELLSEGLQERCNAMRDSLATLLEFVAQNFFRADVEDESHRFVMQPRLNVDREGSGKAEDMAKYEAYQEKLYALVESARTSWREFRRAVKQTLVM